MNDLHDAFNRVVNYMRISVTDRCNMRCRYCMTEERMPLLPRQDLLHFEEIARIVSAAALLGVRRLRITGGEPLVRRNLSDLIARLAGVSGIDDIALSTNAVLLAEHAAGLMAAGLKRVNVSLDSLSRERFAHIANRDYLSRALAGIAAAEEAGLAPIKINCVVMRGINDDELPAIAALSVEKDYHVRFIEMMPLHCNEEWQAEWFMPAKEILKHVSVLGELEPCTPPYGNGPARCWRLPGAKGTVGMISPLTHSYCESCNRIRLTADGQLRLCLFDNHGIDLRTPLRQGATDEELGVLIREAVWRKPAHHSLAIGKPHGVLHALSQVGG